MEHTLENTLKAKKFLIEEGFSENDFYTATEDYVEAGYLLGEPLIKNNDDFITSAFELWKDKTFWEEHGEKIFDLCRYGL